ncbi:MAG: hypothetical protein OXH69_21035, partial [Acidobacteria bacterium]|nr:hypothetical protein [Acidobacteriota bacterium]
MPHDEAAADTFDIPAEMRRAELEAVRARRRALGVRPGDGPAPGGAAGDGAGGDADDSGDSRASSDSDDSGDS